MRTKKNEDDESSQLDYGWSPGQRFGDYFRNSRNMMSDFEGWMSRSVWRRVMVGVATVLITIIWVVLITTLLSNPSSNDQDSGEYRSDASSPVAIVGEAS
ncbi:MAG: hypothetical protein L0G31_11710 [Kocuria sp.]|nr:hypothetical protein [Kocuria sp.]